MQTNPSRSPSPAPRDTAARAAFKFSRTLVVVCAAALLLELLIR